MNVCPDIQRVVETLPEDDDFIKWVKQTLTAETENSEIVSRYDDAELTIRVVNEEESAALNEQYRHKTGSTNVLSFPFEAPSEVEINLLGDLVICAGVVKKQAEEQHKAELAHWAHMVIHGTLHLLGYDHVTDEEAIVMETKEAEIMSQLGYPNPYQEIEE